MPLSLSGLQKVEKYNGALQLAIAMPQRFSQEHTFAFLKIFSVD